MSKGESKITKPEIFACVIGLFLGGFLMYTLSFTSPDPAHSEEYHIHADFLVQIRDTTLDLSLPELMTTKSQQRHRHAHLHDNDGSVIHMHAENISLIEFLASLGITLTNDCLKLIDTTTYCSTDTEQVLLYVNDSLWPNDISSYFPHDLDRILIYFGTLDSATLADHINAVPNEACRFSGSCPERGIAPPESCGLTCEL